MSFIESINFVFSIVLIFFNFCMFFALIANKKIRTKEENLFLYKTLSTVICFSFYIILFIAIEFELCENDRENILYKIQEYLFNIYIILIFTINLFSSLEMYYTYKHPIHYFLLIFGKKTRNIYEIVFILLGVGLLILDILDPFNFNETLKIKNKDIKTYGSPFIVIDNLKWICFILMNGVAVIFNFRLINSLKAFYFGKREKLLKLVRKKIICQYCYLCYAFYNLLIAGILFFRPRIKIKSDIIVIDSFLIFIVLIIDTTIELSIFSTTKFSQYKLQKNIISKFSRIFPNDYIVEEGYEIGKIAKINLSETSEEEATSSEFEVDSEIEKSLLAKCGQDEELIQIYKNDIFMEDYFLSFYDQYINILTASLFKIYNSKLFSIKNVEDKKLKNELGDISVSRIGGVAEFSVTNDLSATAFEKENYYNFSLCKTGKKDNFREFRDILGNTPEDINVKILSYLTDDCVENIIRFNLSPKQIAASLISHFLMKGKNNNNENKYFSSLTSVNVKEEYFKNLKKVSFKSKDKFFNFEFFETKDGSLSNYKVDILNNYFDYIQNGKGKMGSFLPEVIGIFKIKINDFNPVLLYISKNVLVENIPKNFFTFWQLLTFDANKPRKIASSKYSKGCWVKEDNIFERMFMETRKSNISLKNFSEFSEILENDINFLRENKILNVNFLMMYLEYENTKKHETQGALQIRKTQNNEAEIVDIKFSVKSMNNNNLLEKNEENENNKKSDEKSNDMKENEDSDDLFLDEGFDCLPDLGNSAHNLIDYAEKVNISGYEGNYDDFVCMCFFTFENVFDLNNKFGMAPDDKYKNLILSKFSQYKKLENS